MHTTDNDLLGLLRHPPSGRLHDHAVVVTGAGSAGSGWGNGRAAAFLYAAEGAHVAIVDRDPTALAETAALICAAGSTAVQVVADIADADDVDRLAVRVRQELGPVDVLHNNVGILRPGGTLDQTPADWDAVLRTNLTGTWLTIRSMIPAMTTGRGSIVNVSSAAGIRYLGVPYAAYSATKAGILQLSRSTAIEFADRGIRSNAIVPGLMDTPMVTASVSDAYAGSGADDLRRRRADQVPMGRMGDAWDVAYAGLFLASAESGYVTGTALTVDGGLTAQS